MVQVQMNKDIRDFEPKFIGPFTKKQTILVLIAAVYGLPVFFALWKLLDIEKALIITSIICMPPILIGWVKIRGMEFHVFVLRWMYYRIFSPRIRRYKYKPYLLELEEAQLKKEENDKIAAMTKRQLKKYEKEKERQSQVIYSKNPEYKAYK